MTTITVAVCTRDRTQQLERLLQSLAALEIAPQEILVVDNAPTTDASENLVRSKFDGFRYVREPVPGLDFARNRALAEAGHDVVAFVDDDAVVATDWVARIRSVFDESARVGICTGRVEALTLATPGARLFEASGGMSKGERRLHVPSPDGSHVSRRPFAAWSLGLGVGASMAVRRDLALRLGGFDIALDMGAVLPGGGDSDMIWRVLEAGYEVVYEPTVRIWHEHRAEARAAETQLLGHGRAVVATLTKYVAVAPWGRKLPAAAFLAWRLVKPAVRLGRSLVGRDPMPPRFLLQLLAHSWRGLAAYPLAVRLAEQRRREFGGGMPTLAAHDVRK